MKKITLKQNGTFEHVWLKGIHQIPASAIEVTDEIFMQLSQNPDLKKYDQVTKNVSDYIPPFDLVSAKSITQSEIRSAFNMAEQLPVTDGNNVTWSGGYDSALKIDGAKRMAEMAGQTSITLFDNANAPHTLTILEAQAVILTLGADYQTKFATKQALMVSADTATNQADLDAIVVAF